VEQELLLREKQKVRIPFGTLEVGPLAKQRLERALEKNWVSEGPNVEEFEQKFAAKFGYRHAVAVSSGTDADIVACTALYDFGAQRGDEIITPALAFVATANSILAAGFRPVFVDVELRSLNIDPAKIESAITPRTRAIMVVHTMGKPASMEPILDIAKRHHLQVIEDACEAHGARYHGKVVGSIGSMGAFSFYTAHLICSAEGGMVVTNDDATAAVLRSVKSHGRRGGQLYFDFDRIGYNSKMNDLEAAIGIEGIENFDQVFKIRRGHLLNLLESTMDLKERCHFLQEENYEVVCPHAFPLVLRDERDNRDALYAHLENKGIQCKTLFGSLPTQHRAFSFMGHQPGEFPVAEYVGKTGLHFGLPAFLTEADLAYASDALHEYFKSPGE
jgi:dTDP-4-amino-4,6-dideoxygalactose transaminase